MKRFLKRVAQALLASKSSTPNKFSAKYLASFNFQANTLVDIGVARGTPELYDLFSRRKIVLIDPLQGVRELLVQNYSGVLDYHFFQTALGSAEGTAVINTMGDRLELTGIPARTSLFTVDVTQRQEVKVTTLDALLDRSKFPLPYGLKIDTEGYELEVLKGAERTLTIPSSLLPKCRSKSGSSIHIVSAK